MHLTLIPGAQGRPWRGPLARGAARIGQLAGGPDGILDVLEAGLGLKRPWKGGAVRAAELVVALRAPDAFWSASLDVDPLGVAQDLLRLRDELALWGWTGQATGSPRLDQLAAATAGVAPGLAERLGAVADALTTRGLDLQRLDVVGAVDVLPTAWRRVLDALVARGVVVQRVDIPAVEAQGDLAAARGRDFRPTGDGSLQLVRPPGPLQAADSTAAWLASRDDWQDTVVIGADAVLDAALQRHGLPTCGGGGAGDHALLQLLPLVVELGWSPPDPHRALELLTLPVAPLSRGLCNRLVGALQQNPAVGSPAWDAALDAGLAAIEDADRRATMRHRADVLLRPRVPAPTDGAAGGAFPAAELLRRVELLAEWGRGRRATIGEGQDQDGAAWLALDRQLSTVRELVRASGLATLTRAWLRRLVRDATQAASLSAPPPHAARAGLYAVGGPADLAGPAHRVLWWSFERGTVGTERPLPLSAAERAALAALGVAPRPAADRAVDAAARWEQPLLQASAQVVLVCPQRGVDGEALHPHPLWDRVQGRLAKGSDDLLLGGDVAAPPPASAPRDLAPLPSPRHRWTVDGALLPRRPVESPSSAERMVACDLAWVLNYVAKVRAGSSASLPSGNQLRGTLAHEIVAQVLDGCATAGDLDPDTLRDRALDLFDRQGPQLAAPLFQPGTETERERVRRIVGEATRVLAAQLQAGGMGVGATEERRESAALGGTLAGTPDLLASTGAVVDLKWSGAKYREASLRDGTAVQLAAYARAARPSASAAVPPVAYFILAEQRLLTTDPAAFPQAEHVAGPGPGETWLSFERSWQAVRDRLDDGVVHATGLDPDPEATVATAPAGGLSLSPPCRFCDYSGLCGRRMVEPERPSPSDATEAP